MKKILNIEINKCNIKIVSIKVSSKEIIIENSILIDVDKIGKKYDFNKIGRTIDNLENKYKYIYCNLQTEDIIVRTIDNINIKNKKDTIGIIKYELIKYTPINLEEYEIKYKILNKENNIASIQVILFPKYLIDLCKSISKELGIKTKSINVNFDNIQKLIDKNIITNIKDNSVILEVRKDEILLSKVIKNKISESYILPKNFDIEKHINRFDEKIENIYLYGSNRGLDEKLKQSCNFRLHDIMVKIENKAITISKDLDQEISNYINTIGVIT
ncbi:MAG: hypothetical protein ACRDD7_05670 [Peptostreptococcaceae bacterium]